MQKLNQGKKNGVLMPSTPKTNKYTDYAYEYRKVSILTQGEKSKTIDIEGVQNV